MSTYPLDAGPAPGTSRHTEETAPTTPRNVDMTQAGLLQRIDDSITPTRATFSHVAQQGRLSDAPSASTLVTKSIPISSNSKSVGRERSMRSHGSGDVDMDEGSEVEDPTDDESLNADGILSDKKKKTQRFWCTDYPPCNLSFTRSEHLARHIR